MSDLISRSELLNAFNNKNIQITFDLPVEEVLGEDVDLDDFAMLVQDAIQVYKKMVIDTIKLAEEFATDTNVGTNGWIPCSERLPENDDYVLCWYEYRIMQGTHEGEMNQEYGIGYFLQQCGKWGGEVTNGVDCKVIAWKQLPEPYKEA